MEDLTGRTQREPTHTALLPSGRDMYELEGLIWFPIISVHRSPDYNVTTEVKMTTNIVLCLLCRSSTGRFPPWLTIRQVGPRAWHVSASVRRERMRMCTSKWACFCCIRLVERELGESSSTKGNLERTWKISAKVLVDVTQRAAGGRRLFLIYRLSCTVSIVTNNMWINIV